MARTGSNSDTATAPLLEPLLLSPQMQERAGGPPADRSRRKGRRDTALGLRLFLVLLVFAVIAAGFSLKVKPLNLPVVAVAEVEARMNRLSATILPGIRVSLGGIALMLDDNWSPKFQLRDLRLLQGSGAETFLDLPTAAMTLDGAALLGGKLQPHDLTIAGAHLDLRRDLQGRINLQFGNGTAPAIQNLAEFFDRVDAALARPELQHLKTVEFEALSLTLFDERLQRAWELGDGRLVAENRADALAAELAISFLGTGIGSARARMTAVAPKGEGSARISAEVTDIPASELAAQHPVLAWMGAVTAPISGKISLTLQRDGVEALEGALSLGAGALQPSPDATPIDFSKAGLTLAYDPDEGRLRLNDITVESPTVRASGQGRLFMLDDAGQIMTGLLSAQSPAAYYAQLTLQDVRIDPEGLFVAPLQFDTGALDLRLTPDPFLAEIGQFTLSEGDQRLTLSGRAGAAEGGWSAALDMAMNEVTVAKLMQLWPPRLVPKTRAWAAQNILTGDLTDVNGALRITPGAEPVLHLDYDYAQADIRFMAAMPPIQNGTGYSVIDGKVNTIVLTQGQMTPPQGGTLDMAGSSMRVVDIYAKPARAEISLRGRGPAVAMLSVLDQKPFEYLKKAGRPVALGTGDAVMRAEISTPLAKAPLDQITFTAEARVAGFVSDLLVEGRQVAVPDLMVRADKTAMIASGKGTIDGLPFDGAYTLPLRPDGGVAHVTGQVEISARTVDVFDLGLPNGMVKGTAQGEVRIDLPKGAPPELTLVSNLQGATLSLPELAWSKSAGSSAKLTVEARLSTPPSVRNLSFSGADLTAQGTVAFRGDGRLDLAKFDRVTMDGWLDGAVEIKGSTPLGFAVTSGSIDFRRFPSAEQRGGGSGGGTAGSPLTLRLDEFRVTDSITLRAFRGAFTLGNAGVNGQFSAQLGGTVAISGGVAPEANGTGVRVVTTDAGAALQAAGIFDSARGGTADLHLSPRKKSGIYDGRAVLGDLRVKNDNVLADLLNAISVIGLLEQLNGSGIVFNSAEADFVLTPTQVAITRSSAVGASMGVSMEGTYQTETGRLRMGGVISPIYMLNGIGAVLTRKGEGLFGFAYRLDGTADDPDIFVNPLSILTPGMFREIFRRPPPKSGAGSAPDAGNP